MIFLTFLVIFFIKILKNAKKVNNIGCPGKNNLCFKVCPGKVRYERVVHTLQTSISKVEGLKSMDIKGYIDFLSKYLLFLKINIYYKNNRLVIKV